MKSYLWLGLPVVALYASVAHAAETGDMRGRVVDDAGAPVAGATITVSGANIAGVATATTDANGNFQILGLPVGPQEVLVEADEFAPLRMLAQVRLDETVTVPATLTKSTIQEVVIIEAEEPVIDTSRSAISTEMTDDLLQNLPVGRSYQDAVQMLPGIYGKVDTIDGTPNAGNPSVRGEGAYGNNYYVDGISTRDPATKTFGSDVQFDAIESIQVFTDGAPAEFSQATGMMVNVVTKDGGDEHHGSVGYYFSTHLAGLGCQEEDDCGKYPLLDLDSGTEVDTLKRKFMAHELALTAGGPIVKEKLWYFAAVDLSMGWSRFEGQEPESDPLTNRGLAGFGKITWFVTPDVTLQYQINGDAFRGENNISSPLFTPEAQQARNDWQIGHILTAKWRPIPTGELEFKASYLPVNINVVPQVGDKETPQIFNADTGQYTNNHSDYDYNHRDRIGAQLEYTQLAKGAGQHRIKGGAEFWVVHDSRELEYTGGAGAVPAGFFYEGEDYPTDYEFGGIQYTSSAENGYPCDGTDANSDGIWDNCQSFTTYQNVGALGHRGNLFGVYVQDDWRPVDVLALNLGFRLDTETLYQNEGDKIFTAVMPAPRIGVAWDVTGDSKTLISANFGQYYDVMGNGFADWGDTRSAAVFGEFSKDESDVDGDGDTDEYFATNIQDPAGNPLVYCTDDSLEHYYDHMINDYGYDEETAQAEVDIAESYCNGNLRPYHMDKVAVAVEREIIPNLAVGVRGIWSQTINIPEDIDVNLFDTWVIANTPAKKRDYRALEFTVEKGLDKNWGALASWTISESKGHMPGQFELSSGGSTGSSGNDVGVYLDDVNDPDTRAFLYDNGLGIYPELLAGLGRVDDDAGYYGYLPYHSFHQVKVNGYYMFDFGTTFGIVYEFNSGRAWQKRGFNGLYGDYYNFPEGRGSRFMPAVHYIDLRVGQVVKFAKTQSVEVTIDLFNVPDLQAPVTYYENDNESFGLTMFRQTPLSMRAGVKYRF